MTITMIIAMHIFLIPININILTEANISVTSMARMILYRNCLHLITVLGVVYEKSVKKLYDFSYYTKCNILPFWDLA